MSKEQALAMLEGSLRDFSEKEIKLWKRMSLAQREENSHRPGQIKFWSAFYCLLDEERKSREVELLEVERSFHGIQEPIVEWTGIQDKENSVTFKAFYPENIKDPEPKNDPPDA